MTRRILRGLLLTAIVACSRGGGASGAGAGSGSSSTAGSAPAAAGELATAEAAYDAKQWARCAALFESEAAQRTGRAKENALYNAACCHALAGKPDRAFAMLDGAIAAGLRNLDHVKQDSDLASLHADPRWAKALVAIEASVQAMESALGDPALRRELLVLVAEDQEARRAMIDNPGDQARADAVAAIDRKTTARMKEIVAKHGWPGKQLVGDDGAHAAWLLVQHADADLAFQKQCLALIERALAAGDVDPQQQAYLHDRVAVAEKRPQRFGTQFRDGEPAPIEDEANVDARRKAIGLGTMAEYRAQMQRHYGQPAR